MTNPSSENTPLLADDHHPHNALFKRLDSCHDMEYIHDRPKCPRRRCIRTHLTHATLPAGHGHPCHHHMQSPALLLRLEHAIEHGFGRVATAIHQFFKSKRLEAVHLPPAESPYFTVVAVFIIAILTMLAMTAVSPTLLLFMNYSGFTSETNISPYVIASSLSSAIPIFSNIALGAIASRFGPGHALSFGASMAAFGTLIFMFSNDSLFAFLVGYALYAISNSLRVIRVSILTKVVPEEERTTVLATHALMTPIGATIGPMVWIAMQTYRGSLSILGGLLEVNRFTLNYTTVFAVLLSITATASLMLSDVPSDTASRSSERISSGDTQEEGDAVQEVTIHYSNGGEQVVNLDQYRKRVFRFFCAIMFGVNLSAGLFMTAFQPVLVNVFNTSDAKLGLIFEAIAFFAIIPPLLVAVLSKVLMDRQILLIGLASKLVGMALFLPLFGPVREWQVITGFMLIVKASIFFSTATMSLFTKVLGTMSSSALLGILASASNIGPAVAQIALADRIVGLFGTYHFALFAMPAILSFLIIVYPKHWERLDPGREFTRLLMMETQNHNTVP